MDLNGLTLIIQYLCKAQNKFSCLLLFVNHSSYFSHVPVIFFLSQNICRFKRTRYYNTIFQITIFFLKGDENRNLLNGNKIHDLLFFCFTMLFWSNFVYIRDTKVQKKDYLFLFSLSL